MVGATGTGRSAHSKGRTATRRGRLAQTTHPLVLASTSPDQTQLFYLWAAQRRRLQETVIFHENVINFGQEELDELLADLYIIVRTQLDVHDFGWPIDRRRQYCLLLHRKFIHAVLQDRARSLIMCCVCSACIRTRPGNYPT